MQNLSRKEQRLVTGAAPNLNGERRAEYICRGVSKAGVLTWLAVLLSALMAAQGTQLSTIGQGEVTVENCRAINTAGTDFAPAFYRKQLLYVSRPRRGAIDPATRLPYFQLYSSPRREDGQPARNSKKFAPNLSTAVNDGPVSITQGNRVIYFTRALGPTSTGAINLGIFSAYDDGTDWAAVRPMPHNDPAYTNQHPTVTEDGRRIYFASNRPGGFGGYDLYIADYRNGSWGPAINLGPEINTDGNEAFPFIHASKTLFFASDGHPGQGGYDLFGIDLAGRSWGELINLPEPINSSQDDITLVIDEAGSTGYLASNRPGGLGKDDVYLVQLADGLNSLNNQRRTPRQLIVFDAGSSKRLAGANVWVAPYTEAGRLPGNYGSFAVERLGGGGRSIVQQPLPVAQLDSSSALVTTQDGSLNYEFTPGRRYQITVRATGYQPYRLEYAEASADGAPILEFPLERGGAVSSSSSQPTFSAEDFAEINLQLPEISYPYLSANPIIEKSPDLTVLYQFLSSYPAAKVALIVHAHGPEDNLTLQRLSEERAKRLVEYLKERGVDTDRLKTIGYGNRFPVVRCVDCSEAEYEANTRVEAKVVTW